MIAKKMIEAGADVLNEKMPCNPRMGVYCG
jgi:hypothetical protein